MKISEKFLVSLLAGFLFFTNAFSMEEDSSNEKILVEACIRGRVDIVKLLLGDQFRVDVNVEVSVGGDNIGRKVTPLWLACISRSENSVEIIKILAGHPEIDVNKGQLNSKRERTYSPLLVAILSDYKKKEKVSALLKHENINPNLGGEPFDEATLSRVRLEINTPLSRAYKLGLHEVVTLLVRFGVEISSMENYFYSSGLMGEPSISKKLFFSLKNPIQTVVLCPGFNDRSKLEVVKFYIKQGKDPFGIAKLPKDLLGNKDKIIGDAIVFARYKLENCEEQEKQECLEIIDFLTTKALPKIQRRLVKKCNKLSLVDCVVVVTLF